MSKSVKMPALSDALVFHSTAGNEQKRVGRLDFSSGKMVFEGNADESAAVFFEHVKRQFDHLIAAEFERGRQHGMAEQVAGTLAGQMPGKVLVSGVVMKSVLDYLYRDDEHGSYGECDDAILWLGTCTDDEGVSVYGLHVANAECPEEGSLTITDLPEPTA